MTDPITTLFHLTDAIQDLDKVQAYVDRARNSHPENQFLQLELDRKQTEIDRKRALIAVLMHDIRSRN